MLLIAFVFGVSFITDSLLDPEFIFLVRQILDSIPVVQVILILNSELILGNLLIAIISIGVALHLMFNDSKSYFGESMIIKDDIDIQSRLILLYNNIDIFTY